MYKYIAILLYISTLNADNIFKDFLSVQNGDLKIESIQSQQEFISQNRFSKNYIDRVRLNIDYSRFDKESINDEYEIRVYPKTPSQIAAQERLYNLKKDQLNINYLEARELVLKSRYNTLLNTYFKRKTYINKRAILRVEKKRLDLLIKKSNTVSDIHNISKLKNRIKEVELYLMEYKESYRDILLEIGRYINLTDVKKLDIGVKNISLIEPTIPLRDKNSKKIAIKKELNRLQMIKEEIQLNRVSNSLRVNSLDIGYEDRGGVDRSLSLGLSIEYAWPKRNRLQSIEDNLDLIDAQNRVLEAKERNNQEIELLKREIKSLKNRLRYLKKSIKDDRFYNSYRKINNQNPLVILELKKRELEIKEESIEVEHRLYSKFIDFLFVTSTLTEDALFKRYKKEIK